MQGTLSLKSSAGRLITASLDRENFDVTIHPYAATDPHLNAPCTITLRSEMAGALRDFLNHHYPVVPEKPAATYSTSQFAGNYEVTDTTAVVPAPVRTHRLIGVFTTSEDAKAFLKLKQASA